MPRVRRKLKMRVEIAPMDWRFLNDQPGGGTQYDLFRFLALESRSDLARPLWEQQREEILADWMREKSGTRPTCWWRFDAPGKREPSETEAAFLRRHGLLTAAERRRLRPGDFEPVSA